MSTWRRAVAGAVGLFIAVNVVLSLVALLAKLPDLPHTHATADRITVATVLWGDGSIVSPPLVFMVVFALLLWGAATERAWLSRSSVVLIVIGTLVMAVDEHSGDGGLKRKPALYSHAKWDLVLILAWIFILAAATVVASGVGWLVTTARIRFRPRASGGA
jgi:hypothetical protein